MAKKSRRNASRGSVNNIILETLYSGSKYGYEIIKEVEDKTNGDVVLKQPSLYSSLSRFETKGYVTSSWADSDLGGKRHYYELTPAGKKYYEEKVLNKRSAYDFLNDDYEFEKPDHYYGPDDEDVPNNEASESYQIDESNGNDDDSSTNSYSNYSFNVEDRLNSLLSDDESDNEQVENTEIVDDTSSYDDEDDEEEYNSPFDSLEQEEDITSIEQEEDDINSDIVKIHNSYNYASYSDNYKPANDNIKYTNNLSEEISKVYESIKADNSTDIEDSPYIQEEKKKQSMNILYGDKEISQEEQKNKYVFNESRPKYYIDENGITKQYIYVDKDAENKQNIVTSDNKTSDQPDLFNSSDFDEIVKKSKSSPAKKEVMEKEDTSSPELTEDEIEERNRLFQAKFDNIAGSRMKSTTVEQEEDEDNYVDYDDEDSNSNFEENSEEDTVDTNEEESYYFRYNKDEDEVDDLQNEANVHISEYKARSEKKIDNIDQTSYIKINKAKFALGLTLLAFMVVELSLLLFILKQNVEFTTSDNIVFIVAYAIAILISVSLIIPVFFNPNKRKLNTFKFGTYLTISILSFLVLSTLTYAVNAFIGFEISNIEYFYCTLLVPIVLSFNLIVATIAYKIISINKNMY